MVAHTEKTVCEIISNMHMSERVLTGRHSHIGRGGSHAAAQNTYTRRYTECIHIHMYSHMHMHLHLHLYLYLNGILRHTTIHTCSNVTHIHIQRLHIHVHTYLHIYNVHCNVT